MLASTDCSRELSACWPRASSPFCWRSWPRRPGTTSSRRLNAEQRCRWKAKRHAEGRRGIVQRDRSAMQLGDRSDQREDQAESGLRAAVVEAHEAIRDAGTCPAPRCRRRDPSPSGRHLPRTARLPPDAPRVAGEVGRPYLIALSMRFDRACPMSSRLPSPPNRARCPWSVPIPVPRRAARRVRQRSPPVRSRARGPSIPAPAPPPAGDHQQRVETPDQAIRLAITPCSACFS